MYFTHSFCNEETTFYQNEIIPETQFSLWLPQATDVRCLEKSLSIDLILSFSHPQATAVRVDFRKVSVFPIWTMFGSIRGLNSLMWLFPSPQEFMPKQNAPKCTKMHQNGFFWGKRSAILRPWFLWPNRGFVFWMIRAHHFVCPRKLGLFWTKYLSNSEFLSVFTPQHIILGQELKKWLDTFKHRTHLVILGFHSAVRCDWRGRGGGCRYD